MKKLDSIKERWTNTPLTAGEVEYLLRVAKAARRHDNGIPGHAIKDFATGEHEPYCAACILHAVLEEEA